MNSRMKTGGRDVAFNQDSLTLYRGKILVVKIGGSSLADHEKLAGVLSILAVLNKVKAKVVLVHGGGPQINAQLNASGLATKINSIGLRQTPKEAMTVVVPVLDRENKHLVAQVLNQRVPASGLDSHHRLITAVPAEDLSLGFVGHVGAIRLKTINHLLQLHNIVVVSPIGWIGNTPYNINADEVAGSLAVEMGADYLLILADVAGVLKEPQDPKSVIETLSYKKAMKLVADGVVSLGMIPKLTACMKAVKAGVRKVQILLADQNSLSDFLEGKVVGTQVLRSTK